MISDFERIIGDIEKKANLGENVLSKFLDLNDQEVAKRLEKDYLVNYFGGYSGAERVRAIINSSNPRVAEYNIVVYKIEYPKTLQITHRNILGTLMSLGIKRNLIGDIIINDDCAYFICAKEICDFIELEFNEINRQKISIKKVSYQQLDNILLESKKIETIIVPSLRLDVVVSNGFNEARSKVVDSINLKEVYINNKIITKPDYEVKLNDIISYRGHGRIKFVELGKVTKKNRLVIGIEVYK